MSHQPERKEKDCLNCGTEVHGPYCHRCGQENIVTHQSFWALTKHFVFDIFHFDGKFFDTVRYLLFRPGRVPKEYVQGRRTKYLDPIRMYLFTSAVFFLVFFSFKNTGNVFELNNSRIMSKAERFEASAELYAREKEHLNDSDYTRMMALLMDTTHSVRFEKLNNETIVDSTRLITINNKKYHIYPDTDTISISTNAKGQEVWLSKKVNEKWKKYKSRYGDDVNEMSSDLTDKFLHWFPYILFVSLPLFALILKLLYVRRKEFFYSDHAIFTLYHYIFSFILLLLFFGFNALEDKTGLGIFNVVLTLLFFAWPVYLLFSLRRFYGQGWAKTVGKFLLLNILGIFSLFMIFMVFIGFFIYQL